MPKHIRVTLHLTVEELERRYRQAHDPVERTHWQIIWLLAQGWLTREVAAATGYSVNWIQQLARRYNADGPAGLGDRRHQNPGQAPALDAAGQAALQAALAGAAPDGGFWSGRAVADWLATRLGQTVSRQQGWVWLRRLGSTPQFPRPAHADADPEEQAAFPKDCASGSRRSNAPSPARASRSGRKASTGSA
jgi:transposase